MEAVECGAAALGIVLSYFGKHVPLERLRVDCGVSRNGSTAGNLVRAARNHGLEVHAYKKEPEQLRGLSLPMIVFWNFSHFLVVEGFGKDIIYLNDPAAGPRTVDAAAFDASFTGVVMTFQPGPEFQPGGDRPSVYPFLRRWLRGYAKSMLFLLLACIALIVPGLAVPVFSRIFVDQVLINNSSSWMLPLLTGIALTTILRALISWLQQASLIRFEMSMSLKNSSAFFWHVLHLPMTFHTQRPAGEISTRIGVNDEIAALLTGQLGSTFLNLFTIVFYASLMLWYSVPLTIVAIAISLLNVAALKYISRRRIDSNQRFQSESGRLYGLSSIGLQMIESLKATASESDFFARWAGSQAKLLNVQQRLGVLTQSLQVVPVFLTTLGTIVILLFGSGYIIAGTMTVGTFVAFQALMASFSQPIVALVNLGSALQDVQGGIRRIEDVYSYPADMTALPARPPAKTLALEGSVELCDITFGYSPMDPPLITGFSLSLKPGSRVAIVGRTGCGKSTIANLVAGLYEPWSGGILFDGTARRDVPPAVLYTSIAMVDQNLFLFEGSVKDNISFWDHTIPDTAIMQAAKDACIHEDVAARPGAYESAVSENGRNFSGGQRQRLEIARALAMDPSILVLDEATSALDAQTEQMIDANIRRRGCTCLIVAHRVSTIRDCDEIIVMDNGHIVQRGTHDELVTQKGPYRQLITE
jgi:NHLM bacteriocin system ABC transporter peptidase/ATP-binding protein